MNKSYALGKKQVAFIFITLFVIMFLSYYSVQFITKSPAGLTGYAIYSSQPNATEGEDTYLRENSGSNYGTDATMKLGQTAAGVEFRPFLKFNISSIPSGDTVTNAVLQLYLNRSDNNNFTAKLYRVTSDWNETAANWTYRTPTEIWWAGGGDYADLETSVIVGNTSGLYYNFTITSLVQSWIDGTYDNYGLVLVESGSSAGDIREFASSDCTVEAQRPLLYIDHTSNAAPAIHNLSQTTALTNPAEISDTVTFTVNWTDAESDNGQLFICNTSEVNATQCINGTFCNTSLSSTAPVSCGYTVQSTDNRTTNFWAFVCDGVNCSTGNASQFYMNHPSTIAINQPDGGETINQSADGNYNIQFNFSDPDSDKLTAYIYYGETQNSTANLINSSLNMTAHCTDPDSDTSTTPNICSIPWNTTGIYGTFYMTIITNDTFTTSNDSSASSFNVYSLSDNIAPNITAQWVDTGRIYSGKQIQFYANVSDTNPDSVWVTVNVSSTLTNYTMTNTTATAYNVTWTATTAGNHTFKVYAEDTTGNTNNSMSWDFVNITAPNATTQNETAPSTALPFHVIKTTGQINASDPLINVSAYLNIPDGFTFLTDYPQSASIGNISANTTGTATWYLSSPITEDTYTLNITYTDKYSNSWTSDNFNITTTSSVGGGNDTYDVSVAGYTEVETGENYYVESYFKKNGIYESPDSMSISIYDAAGSLTVGPVAMTEEDTGIYNYTYAVSASATEGLWETIINATESSTSYYAHEFWNVVGGPFDIRTITILDSEVPDLNISFIAENTGGANKDLILNWNLSREDTSANLDSGSETRMVPANSEITWYITPSTTYVGQARITLLGYYSGTEKAGAYETFSTTSGSTSSSSSTSTGGGGGGGGGATTTTPTYQIEIEDFSEEIKLIKNTAKTITIKIKNTGNKAISNLAFEITNLDETYYTISPEIIESIKPGKTKEFKIEFLVTDFTGEKEAGYFLKSDETTLTKKIKIIVTGLKDYLLSWLEELRKKASELKIQIGEETELLSELSECENILDEAETKITNQDFTTAEDKLQDAEKCLNEVEEQIGKIPFIKIPGQTIILIIIIILIILLLAAFIYLIYLLKRKLSIASFADEIRKRKEKKIRAPDIARERSVDDKIKNIRKNLEGDDSPS